MELKREIIEVQLGYVGDVGLENRISVSKGVKIVFVRGSDVPD